MLKSVPHMGAEVIDQGYHRRLNPNKTDSAFVLLDASHISLDILEMARTRYATLNIFTCGDANPFKGYIYLQKELNFPYAIVNVYERF
jgi:S-adenosylmethionine/arginine decarboxylase-like enzyme